MSTVLLLVVVGLILIAVVAPRAHRIGCLCLACGCIAGWSIAELRISEADSTFTGFPTEVVGTVTTDPRTTSRGTLVPVTWQDEQHHRQETNVFIPPGVELGRGDRLTAYGEMSRDGGSALFFARETIVEHRADRLELTRRSIRIYISRSMARAVPGSPGSLVLGLLIGDDTGLARVERDDLRVSGVSHITAVSGWNVSVVVVSVGALFHALGARTWPWLVVQLLFLYGYVWIVGLEPPIQRAAIMGTVALVALQLGRPAHMLTLLTLTAGVMAAWSPEVLSSLSFMLSFLAMLGLVVAARITGGMTGWKSALLTPPIVASFAGIATAPLIAATFGTISFMTVPANVAIAPLVPVATFAGMFVMSVSWLGPLTGPVAWAAWIISSAILWIARLFAGVPGAHVRFSPMPASTVFTIYFGIALMVLPCLPEGRAALRSLDIWYRGAPAAAVLSSVIALAVIAIGVLAA